MIPFIYSVNSVRQRYKSTLSIVAAVALFVFVLSMVQMLAQGIERTMVRTSDPDTLVVLSTGSDIEMASLLSPHQIESLTSLPSAHVRDMVREFVIVKMFPKTDTRPGSIVMIRGVPDNVYRFRKDFRLLAGRLPAPGGHEVLAGRSASQRLADLQFGRHVELAPGRLVTVVGVFQCADSSFDSELWGDIDMIRGLFGRQGVTSSLRIRMDRADMPALIQEARQHRLALSLQPEPVFTRQQAKRPKQFIETIGLVLGLAIGMASIIAVSTIMQTAVDGRQQDILLFRKMGVPSWAIVVTFLWEAALLGLLGGVAGVSLSLGLTAYKTTVMNVGTWSQLVVGFSTTPWIIGASLAAGLLAVVLGASLPTLRVARQLAKAR